MARELLNNFNKPYLRWEYDEENRWLYLNWIGFVSHENVIRSSSIILNEIKENRYAYILNDNRELCGPWDGSNDWLEKNWIPKAHAAGLEYFAHVLAPNVAGALSAQDMHRRTLGTFQMQLFGDIEKAREWLKKAQIFQQDCINK